jgi:ATP-dependent Clp protease ATP-binding subunit ClpC
LLLQILEDGKLSDSHGRTVSFRQTIIILTSNVGAEQMIQDSELGFGVSGQKKLASENRHEKNSRAALRELEEFLRPELIGRFDSVITFKPLSRSVVRKIFDNLTSDLIEAVGRHGMTLDITSSAKRWLIDRGFDEQRGVRVLRRTIQSELADPLSDVLLSNKAKPGDTLEAKIDNDKVVINVNRA